MWEQRDIEHFAYRCTLWHLEVCLVCCALACARAARMRAQASCSHVLVLVQHVLHPLPGVFLLRRRQLPPPRNVVSSPDRAWLCSNAASALSMASRRGSVPKARCATSSHGSLRWWCCALPPRPVCPRVPCCVVLALGRRTLWRVAIAMKCSRSPSAEKLAGLELRLMKCQWTRIQRHGQHKPELKPTPQCATLHEVQETPPGSCMKVMGAYVQPAGVHHAEFEEVGRVAWAALHAKKALWNAPGQLLSKLRALQVSLREFLLDRGNATLGCGGITCDDAISTRDAHACNIRVPRPSAMGNEKNRSPHSLMCVFGRLGVWTQPRHRRRRARRLPNPAPPQAPNRQPAPAWPRQSTSPASTTCSSSRRRPGPRDAGRPWRCSPPPCLVHGDARSSRAHAHTGGALGSGRVPPPPWRSRGVRRFAVSLSLSVPLPCSDTNALSCLSLSLSPGVIQPRARSLVFPSLGSAGSGAEIGVCEHIGSTWANPWARIGAIGAVWLQTSAPRHRMVWVEPTFVQIRALGGGCRPTTPTSGSFLRPASSLAELGGAGFRGPERGRPTGTAGSPEHLATLASQSSELGESDPPGNAESGFAMLKSDGCTVARPNPSSFGPNPATYFRVRTCLSPIERARS